MLPCPLPVKPAWREKNETQDERGEVRLFLPKKVNVTQKSRRESVSDKLSDNFIEYNRINTGKMQKLESELDNLTEEESELMISYQ